MRKGCDKSCWVVEKDRMDKIILHGESGPGPSSRVEVKASI